MDVQLNQTHTRHGVAHVYDISFARTLPLQPIAELNRISKSIYGHSRESSSNYVARRTRRARLLTNVRCSEIVS